MTTSNIEEPVAHMTGEDQRISRTATIHLSAPIDKVFPLFGPVLEKEWAYGWNPEIIFSRSKLVEEGMVFRTRTGDEDFIWVVSKYMPEVHTVEYRVHAPNRVWSIHVACRRRGDASEVRITYTYTALTKEAIELNRSAIDKMFEFNLKDWEEAITFYLTTGRLATPDQLTTSNHQLTTN